MEKAINLNLLKKKRLKLKKMQLWLNNIYHMKYKYSIDKLNINFISFEINQLIFFNLINIKFLKYYLF